MATFRVTAKVQLPDGQVSLNVYHYDDGASEPTPGEYQDIVSDLGSRMLSLYTEWVPLAAPDAAYLGVDVSYRVAATGEWLFIGTSATNLPGANTNDSMLPHFVALPMTLPIPGRAKPGAKRFPGGSEQVVLDGQITATALTDLIDVGAQTLLSFTGGFSGRDFAPGIWSVKDTLFAPYGTSAVFPLFTGSQNTRKPGRGS